MPAPPLLNSEPCGWWMTRKKSAWNAGGPPMSGSTPSGMITAFGCVRYSHSRISRHRVNVAR
jgi:hypothetical protein